MARGPGQVSGGSTTAYELGTHGRLARRKAKTRAAIIAAAGSLFHERGYEATSIVQIAEAANAGVGTLYGYFASKDAILRAVVESRRAEALGQYRAAVGGDTPYPDRVWLALQALSTFVRDNRSIMAAAFREVRSSGTAEGPSDWLHTAFSRLIAEGVEKGELRPVPADGAARVLVSSCMLASLGIGPWHGVSQDAKPIAELERITRMLLAKD